MLLNSLAVISLILVGIGSAVSLERPAISQYHERRETGSVKRQMVAASRLSKLAKRADHLELCKSFDLEYIEAETLGHAGGVAATVHAESRKAVLLLEEYEHLMHQVECSDDGISISFPSSVSSSSGIMNDLEGGFIISSHDSCNEEGDRGVFRVEGYELSQDGTVTSFSVRRMAWKAAFPQATVKIDQVHNALDYQPRNGLLRRQQTPTSTSSIAATATETHSFPIATQFINKDFSLDEWKLRCKNCTFTGSLVYNSFGANLTSGELSGASIGFSNFSAHVALSVDVPSSEAREIPLPFIGRDETIDMGMFGEVRFIWAPLVTVEYEFNGDISFEYGFNVEAPNTAQITVDLDDLSSSSTTGFDDWNATALPFNSSVEVRDLTMKLGLRNRFTVEYRSDEKADEPDFDAGLYLDLPTLSAKFIKMESVDADCNPLASSSAPDKDVMERVITNAYSLEPSVEKDFGVSLNDNDTSLLNPDPLSLPKACLNFDSESKSYMAASELVKEEKANAGRTLTNPFSDFVARPFATMSLVLVVIACLA